MLAFLANPFRSGIRFLTPFRRHVRLIATSRCSCSENSQENIPAHVQLPYSYAFGRSQRTLNYETLSDVLEHQSQTNGSKVALVSHHEHRTVTFSELSDNVNQVVRVLLHLGVKHGDVIALWSCNTYRYSSVQFACARLGAILCTLNPVYKVKELDYALRKSRAKVLFMPGKNSEQNPMNNYHEIIHNQQLHESLSSSSLEHIIYLDDEAPNKIGKFDSHSLPELQSAQSSGPVDCHVDPSDPAMIMFTSGTTGNPKGACLSHFTLVNNARLTGEKMGFLGCSDTVVCSPLPLFHAMANVMAGIVSVVFGSTMVLNGMKFTPRSVVESIVKNNCTHVLMTPTMIIDMLNYIEKHNVKLTSLEGILAGGAQVPVDVAARASKVIPSLEDVRIGYGATELGPVVSACEKDSSAAKKLETVGTPLDFVEVKLINPSDGKLVKIGEHGELLARGHNVMLGYWEDEVKTREAIDKAGWYHTGDMATMDEEGYIKIVGRTKEMIIRGGENIYPKEVEEFLHEHPEILCAFVVGVPDERMGEECCAWVQLRNPETKLTQEDVKSFLKDRISYFKIPKYVLFVEDFPLTSTGKAQKFIMREKSCEILGLKEPPK
ncbi:Medium-chain acyl-CoA ligase ACSF2, mitochondrial [Halotydeus destructor]|nr:Medium-chain acyl-CoA ligase ACSF2, mitochondrial [Halotydeus destructor]